MEATTSSSVKYQPKFGRILIKREVQEKIGSIYIPDAQQKRHAACEGVIIALGETAGFTDTYYEDADGSLQLKTVRCFQAGQRVLFGRHAGAWLDSTQGVKGENDDGTLFICQDQDILAVINE